MSFVEGSHQVNTTGTHREGTRPGHRADREQVLQLFAQQFSHDPMHALESVSEQDVGYILAVARAFDWSVIRATDPSHLLADRSSTYVYPPSDSAAAPLWTALRNQAHRLGFFIRPKYDRQQQHTVINVLVTDVHDAARHQAVLTTWINALKTTLAEDEVIRVISRTVAEYTVHDAQHWTIYANVALARQGSGGAIQDGTLNPITLI